MGVSTRTLKVLKMGFKNRSPCSSGATLLRSENRTFSADRSHSSGVSRHAKKSPLSNDSFTKNTLCLFMIIVKS